MHFSAALVVYYTSDKRREALEFEESGFFFCAQCNLEITQLKPPQLFYLRIRCRCTVLIVYE